MIKLMSSHRDKVEDIYIKIENAKDINDLIGAYQVILHNLRNLSNLYLSKVKRFLNDFYIPTKHLSEILKDSEILNKFIQDPCNIIRFKNLLSDLNDYSQTKSSGYSYISPKVE